MFLSRSLFAVRSHQSTSKLTDIQFIQALASIFIDIIHYMRQSITPLMYTLHLKHFVYDWIEQYKLKLIKSIKMLWSSSWHHSFCMFRCVRFWQFAWESTISWFHFAPIAKATANKSCVCIERKQTAGEPIPSSTSVLVIGHCKQSEMRSISTDKWHYCCEWAHKMWIEMCLWHQAIPFHLSVDILTYFESQPRCKQTANSTTYANGPARTHTSVRYMQHM